MGSVERFDTLFKGLPELHTTMRQAQFRLPNTMIQARSFKQRTRHDGTKPNQQQSNQNKRLQHSTKQQSTSQKSACKNQPRTNQMTQARATINPLKDQSNIYTRETKIEIAPGPEETQSSNSVSRMWSTATKAAQIAQAKTYPVSKRHASRSKNANKSTRRSSPQ